MRLLSVICITTIALMQAAVAVAQDGLVRTYNGTRTVQSRAGEAQVGMQLVVDSADNGVVKGTAKISARNRATTCAGDYPMEGTYQENTLKLKTIEKGGVAADCGLILNLKHEGNKLVGTTGNGLAINLSK
jgi:hypothetical protein